MEVDDNILEKSRVVSQDIMRLQNLKKKTHIKSKFK
jgi:hypothetical protein